MIDTNETKGSGRSPSEHSRSKQPFDFRPRVKMRLSEIERLIRKHRIIVPPLSRQYLIKLCEDGTLETVGTRPTPVGWLVYEDSFHRWLRSLDESA